MVEISDEELSEDSHSSIFVEDLDRAIALLSLIDKRLTRSQSDKIHVSDIYDDWLTLKSDVVKLQLPEQLHRHGIEYTR